MEKWTRIVHTPRLGRRLMALLLCLSMLSSYLPVFALAEAPQPVLCEHHPEHDATCGYQEAVAGQDCTHDHGEECYSYQTACLHQHTESCYTTAEPTEEGQAVEPVLNCSHVCSSAPICLHQHGDECYTDGELTCTHDHSTDVGCVTRVLNCQHQHDATCGFVAAVPAQSCTYHCDDCCPHDDEPASCVCDSKCTESSCNQECPVCKDDWNSCEFKEASVTTSGCICSKTCTETEKNAECPVCADAPDACEYVEPVCVCQSKCTEELHNSECPVCASAPGSCTYEEPVCNCQSKCTEEAINSDCPVCNSDITGCTYEEPVCNCQSKCTEEAINSECPVCNSDITGCTFVEPVCNCQSKCTEESYNTQCPVCGSDPAACGFTEEQEPSAVVITGWNWIFEEEVLGADTLNELPLNASEEMPAFFENVVFCLPDQISAALEGQTEPTPLTLTWACPGYPETGAYEGEYTFTAALPTGFSLAEGVEAPSILVTFGGASALDSGDAVANVTIQTSAPGGGTISRSWTTIEGAFEDANGWGNSCDVTLKLLNNCSPTGNLTVTGNFILDTNSYEIEFSNNYCLYISGSLRIQDSKPTAGHYSIRGSSQTKVIVQNGGYLGVSSGASIYNSVQNGCCVKIEDGGNVTVSGGYLKNDGGGCIIDNSTGTLIVDGGKFYPSNDANTFNKLTEGMLKGGTFGKLTVADKENSVDLRKALGGDCAYFSGTTTEDKDLFPVGNNVYAIDRQVTVGEHNSHTFTYTVSEDGTQHTAKCGCGYSVTENHENQDLATGSGLCSCGRVKYLDANGNEQTVNSTILSGSISEPSLGAGTYSVLNNASFDFTDTVTLTGTVNLILPKGSKLSAQTGINIVGSLNVYGTAAEGGTLEVGTFIKDGQLNVYGGTIDVNTDGNEYAVNSAVNIYGGIVSAKNTSFTDAKAFSQKPTLAEGKNWVVKVPNTNTSTYDPVESSEKDNTITNGNAVVISICSDHNGASTYKDGDNHTITCKWCGYTGDEKHTFPTEGATNTCTKCGAVTVSYQNEQGTESVTVARKLESGSGITLSTGWYVVSPDENSAIVEISDRLEIQGSVSLILPDNSTLNANQGIHVPEGKTLTIYAQSQGKEMGALNARGSSFQAGIGGNDVETGSSITIHGGTIKATGGHNGAGIGGGSGDKNVKPSGGTITISGGKITANGGNHAAGIGGGYNGAGGTITISGGTIEASGGSEGAGIGGGFNGAGGTVTISGGTIEASGGGEGAGIGDGYDGTGGTVTISGGTVRVQGGIRAFSVAPNTERYSNFKLSVGTQLDSQFEQVTPVTYANRNSKAYTTNKAVVIQPCEDHSNLPWVYQDADCHNVTCEYCGFAGSGEAHTDINPDGGTPVCTKCGYGYYSYWDGQANVSQLCAPLTKETATGDLSGWYVVQGTVNIDNRIQAVSTLNLILSDGSILNANQGIHVFSSATLNIFGQSGQSGKLNAKAPLNVDNGAIGAAIGGDSFGDSRDCGTLNFNGGIIEATVGGTSSGCAAIGGGEGGSGGTITVNRGSVTANITSGRSNGAAIGGGYNCSGGSIYLNGGEVKATISGGNSFGAAIGGGYNGGAGTIIIDGATVYATVTAGSGQSAYGAAIGSGSQGRDGTITIQSGTVNATISGGTTYGAAIGGGGNDSNSFIDATGPDIFISGDSVVNAVVKDSVSYGAAIGSGNNNNPGKIVISGGTVTATHSNAGNYGTAIGSGNNAVCNYIAITGGTVTATAPMAAIGGGSYGSGNQHYDGGTFIQLTNDVHYTNNQYASTPTSGIRPLLDNAGNQITENGKPVYVVYGTAVMQSNLNIPENMVLLIPEGTTLNVENVQATNSGTVFLGGDLVGKLLGNGSVYYRLTLVDTENNKVEIDNGKTNTVTFGNNTYAKAGEKITLKLATGKMVKLKESDQDVTFADDNTFTMPNQAVTIKFTLADIVATVSCLDATTKLDVTTNYANIGDALTAANSATGSTLKLMKDVEVVKPLHVFRDFTLDLNGKSLVNTNQDANKRGDAIWIDSDCTLTIIDSSANQGGSVVGADAYAIQNANGNLLLGNNGDYNNLNITIKGIANNGNLYIYSGKVISDNAIAVYNQGGHVEVYGNAVLSGRVCISNNDSEVIEGTVDIHGGEFQTGNLTFNGNVGGVKLCGDSILFKAKNSRDIAIPWDCGVKLEHILADGHAYFSRKTTEDTTSDEIIKIGDATGIATAPGFVVVKSHTCPNPTYTYVNKDNHTTFCNECGVTRTVKHAFIDDSGESPVYSEGTCPCGAANIKYMAYDAESKTVKMVDTPVVCEPITSTTTALSGGNTTDGWYVVSQNVEFEKRLNVNGDVHLILMDNTTLTAKEGIHVSENNSLSIYAQSDGNGMGALAAAYSGSVAAIGGNFGQTCGAITIHGGKITANGGPSCAGIGGGYDGAGGSITIYGGDITANGGTCAAGIGGGENGAGGNITIYGGKITASCGYYGEGYGSYGAGIGGGYKGAGGSITIHGGTITATGGVEAAGIGGGYNGAGVSITISGGKITANGGDHAAGIGGGRYGAGGTINISGGKITADGGNWAAGIGGGHEGAGGKITIGVNAHVTATGKNGGAGIGGGNHGAGVEIAIYGGTIKATGNGGGAGIGGGAGYGNNKPSAGTIDISGGTITATGNDGGAGIGGGSGGSGGKITIYGGDIEAKGGDDGAGIGGGDQGAGVEIAISGGNITATGGKNGAGIGGGCDSSSGVGVSNVNISISGNAEVTARGGFNGAGIGGGCFGDGGSIKISGGTITADGGFKAAGIGSGYGYNIKVTSGGNIQISGGTVTAKGGSWAAGIGGGHYGNGGNVTISGDAKVTATSGNSDGYTDKIPAGIGSGAYLTSDPVTITGGTVTINGGTVTALSTGDGTAFSVNPTLGGDVHWKVSTGDNETSLKEVTYTARTDDEYSGYTTSPAAKIELCTVHSYAPVYVDKDYHKICCVWCDVLEKESEPHDFNNSNSVCSCGAANIQYLKYVNGNMEPQPAQVCEPITSTTTTLSGSNTTGGWYVVSRNVTLNTRLEVRDDCEVHLILMNGMRLDATEGIYVQAGCSLSIYAQSTDQNEMGKLVANAAEHNAAIGGSGIGIENGWYSYGKVIIHGGDITANGGDYSAAIGGSNGSHRGYVTIYGGKILANGGEGGAGIGDGMNSKYGSDIFISGGDITANGGDSAPGIGVGSIFKEDDIEDFGFITISGGTVRATGGDGDAGIGTSGAITISGGTVIANGTGKGAGIGWEEDDERFEGNYSINISGGNVTATGGENSVGIGCNHEDAEFKNSFTITISGGTVRATGNGSGAAIGSVKGAKFDEGFNVIISGGTVIATSTGSGAAIGSVEGAKFKGGFNVVINGGTVTATGGIGGSDAVKFSTGENGKAVIFASSISDQTGIADWQGVIFQGDDGKVYGDSVAPEEPFTLLQSHKLLIPQGVTLDGTKGTNNGKIYVDGTLSGTVGGQVYYPLSVSEASYSVKEEFGGKTYGQLGSLITLTPPAPAGDYVFKQWVTEDVDITNNQFTMPAKPVAIIVNSEPAVSIVAYTSSLTTNYGTSAELGVTIRKADAATAEVTYQWYLNGTQILGANKNYYNTPANLNAGSYTYTCTITCGPASVTTQPIPVTVNKAGRSVTINALDKTYDGQKVFMDGGFSYPGDGAVTIAFKTQGASDSTYTAAAPVSAGSYTVRVSVAEGTNHKAASAVRDFTIGKKPLTVTITPNGGTYGGTITPATAALVGVVAGEKVEVKLTYNGSAQVPSNAGSYTVTASISDGNYQLTGTTTAQFVIQKATVNTPTVASKDYNGKNQTADIQDTDLYTVTKNEGGVEIGSYEVVLTLKDPSNYQWDENGGRLTFEVVKAGSNTWTTQPDIDDWTYGDAPSTPTAAARYGTVKVDYTADGKTYTEAVPTQAGTYKARFTVAETDRYSGLEMHKSFTINSRPVTVTITPNGGTYGGTITPASAVLTGAAAGEKVDVSLTYNGSTQVPTKAGSYTVTASISDGNYQLTGTTAAEFVIQKATVKTPTVASKDYNGKNQTADIQDTDLYTVTKNEGGVEIGSYEVVLTLKDPSNYQWDKNGGKLTFEIVKAGSNTWTTQPDIDGWTYGDAPSTPTAEARYGTVLVDYTADGKTYTEAVPTQAGTYKARFTVAETGDHNGLEMEKEFTIAKRPVTVSGIKAESKTYDAGTAAKLNLTEAVLNGKLASDDLTFTATGTFKDAKAGQGKTVTISVTLGGKSAANYAVTGSLTAKADIARRELTLLRVRIADKQYDGLNTASFYMPPVLSGVCGNDQVILVSGVPTFETVEVGTGIKVNVTPFDLHGPDSMNYTLIQPTGLTGNIVNNYHPEAGLDYTTTGGQWSNQNFVITAKEGNTLSTGNTADGTWKNELTVSQEGEGELTFYVRDDSTGAISNPVTVSYMVDKTAPTGSILFDGADVTDRGDGRAIYKNADVKVTITGSDALSGVAELAYYQSNAVLNHAQVEAVTEWTPGNGFTLKAENGASCVVYAKVTDKAGNVAYFRSFQLLFDTDAPGLSGIVDGATYYTTQIVHVDDEALQSLTLNGENVTSPVTLPGNTDGTYTITATDKAGNSTTCTVTMKKISSLYEQVADINSENVGKSDKAALEAAKSALEALPVSPVEAENREIQDALSNINAALKALENAAEVQRQIDSLPDTAKPGDTAAKEEVNRVRENYDKLTEHEKSLVETKKLEELEDALGFHRIVEGAGSVWFKGSGLKLTFKANGSMEGFTGVKLDGKLITAFTTDPGSNAVALEPALLQGLTLGEHKLRFVYADGETRDAVFTVKVSPNYLDLEGKDEFNGQTEVWVDGVAYPVETVGGRYVNLPDSGSLLTVYTYQQGNSNGSHDNYPTGMKVYRIERTQNGATVEHLAALDDLLQYSGCSIRVNGKQGIRMITSLTQQNKDALTSTGLAGFTLEEYGTVVSWVKELGNASLTLDNGRHNYAYKKDVADPIFAASGGLTQYTNVLVGFNLEQCKDDIVMRPYIVLKDADGQLVTLYGGTVTRSIGYIACQNRNTFQPGSAAYQYVWEIIHSAYGDQFDSEYQG